jgi:hypothetical protein
VSAPDAAAVELAGDDRVGVAVEASLAVLDGAVAVRSSLPRSARRAVAVVDAVLGARTPPPAEGPR